MNDKRGSQSLTHLDSRKCSPTRRIARAIANGCRSNEDGDVVDEVMVVEIKSFAVAEIICETRLHISTSTTELIPLRPEHSKQPNASCCQLHRWSFSRHFCPSIHHISTNFSVAYSRVPHDGLPAYGTTGPSRPAPQTLQTLRSSIAWLAFQIHFQPELRPHSTESTCPVTLDWSNFHPFVLGIPAQIFESGVDYTDPVQTVWVRCHSH